jgi:multisubunit Na+/H+ antiporter MnhB subunit
MSTLTSTDIPADISADIAAGQPSGDAGPQVFTGRGARGLDRVAVREAETRAEREQLATQEQAALSALRIEQARTRAAEEAQDRAAARRREQQGQQEAARAQTRAARRARAAERAAARRQWWLRQRTLCIVAPFMAASAAVAAPAQFHYYADAPGGDPWSAAAVAAMVEGGTWVGAVLETYAIDHDQPTTWPRVLTWGLAGLAAAINFTHGLTRPGGGLQIGVVLGMASLLGPVIWGIYSLLRGGRLAGRTREDWGKQLWRRIWHPILSWRATDLRATSSTPMTIEESWAQTCATRRARRHARTARKADRRAEVRPRAGKAAQPVKQPPTQPIDPDREPIDPDREPIDPDREPIDPIDPDPIETVEPGRDDDQDDDHDDDHDQAENQADDHDDADDEDQDDDQSDSDPASAVDPGAVLGRRRSMTDLRVALARAIARGPVPAEPHADLIRSYLRCSPKRARQLRDEGDAGRLAAIPADLREALQRELEAELDAELERDAVGREELRRFLLGQPPLQQQRGEQLALRAVPAGG